MKSSETISKISSALLKAQSSMGNAQKGATNPYFKSSYADLNSIREAVTPALNANGITLLQPTIFVDGKVFVETVLLHESGEFLSSLTEIVVAKVGDPQAAGSGISYARRYGLQSFLSVGAMDDDGEAAMSRTQKSKFVATSPIAPGVKSEAKSEVSSAASPEASPPAQQAESVSKPTAKKMPFNKPGNSNKAPESNEGSWG